MKEDWTQQLRNLMADYEEPAPEGLWDDIASALPDVPARRRSRLVALRRWAVAAVILLAVGGALVLWNSAPQSVDNRRATARNAGVEEDRLSPQSGETVEAVGRDICPSTDGTVTALNNTPRLAIASLDAEKLTTGDEHEKSAAPEEQLMVEEGSAAQGRDDTPQDKRADSPASRQPSVPVSSHLAQAEEHPSTNRRHPHNRVTVSLLASNMMSSSLGDNVSREAVQLYSGRHFAMYHTAYSNASGQPAYVPGFEEKSEHHQPVSVGVVVSWPLSRRVSVESGLTYSWLSSDFTKKLRADEMRDHQKLHYVGIPLRLRYGLWKSRHVSAYVVAGGVADVNVKATYESGGDLLDVEKDRVQWLVAGAVGASLQVIPRLSVFVEPGLRYYFDNKSDVQNIFKDKKLNFDMQFGMRYEVK